MPSVVVHVAFAGLLATALLGEEFDPRAILVVMVACALVDLDTFVGIYVPGTHRAAFHNVFVVTIPGLLLLWDGRLRETSVVRTRFGQYGYRVAWLSLVAVLAAHVSLDAFFNGVNVFWPVHDRFYDFSGRMLLTDQRGLVQTFLELETTADGTPTVADSAVRGTTDDTHYATGFDPTRGDPGPDTERIFPVASSGELFVVTLASYGTVLYRCLEYYR